MAGWRAIDQEPVASRQAVAAGIATAVDAVAALGAGGERPVIAACWQDEAYVDVPPGALSRLADLGDTAVACTGSPRLGPATCHVPIEAADDAIAAEWSVVALTRAGGIAVVAHEVPATLPAGTVEGGRAFRYDVTTDARVVIAHARRLQRTFGARLTPEASARIGETITALVTTVDSAGEDGADVLAGWAMRVGMAVDVADDVRRDGVMEPSGRGGLATLADWLADAGPRSPALGMIVVRSGTRGVTGVLREHATQLGRLGDLIVDVPPDAAMVVLPGLYGDALESRAHEVASLLCEQLATGDVQACAVEVPAVQARRDLVGSLGMALAQLRNGADAPARPQDRSTSPAAG